MILVTLNFNLVQNALELLNINLVQNALELLNIRDQIVF